MSCNCKLYQKKLEKLQNKYTTLRKNHKKLLGVTVLLTDALEDLVKGDKKPGVNEILLICSSVYPDLFNGGDSERKETDSLKIPSDDNSIQIIEDVGEVFETATESEREYYEGFMARPKIPRTPQV